MRKILFFIFILTPFLIKAQENSTPTKKTQKGFIAIDFLSTKMPDDALTGNPEINMGLTGTHYNLWLTDKIYGGFGFYGSVAGKRGGLFTLGINLGTKINLANNLFFDTGFHFGGGGGASAPDGGGAFILPHFTLEYQFDTFSVNAGYSYINFFDNGNIVSSQVKIGVQIPVSFDYTDFKNSEKKYSLNDLKPTKWHQKAKKISLLMHANNLSPTGNSKLTDGVSLKGTTIRLAGFEINSYFTDNWFGFFKVDGAYHGIRGGYMDILFGAGYQLSLNKNRTNILAKFGIGAGGGGGVDSGGGFFVYPDISIEQKLFDNVFLSINKGFLSSPDKKFTSTTLGFGLKYYVHQQGIINAKKILTNFKIKGIEIVLAEDVYLNAKRMLQATENLYQISFQANLYLNTNFYIAGKTSFANFGNAGAYAEGVLGIGYKSNPFANNKLNVFIQGLAGAAGGGDISTGQGFIIKPSAGFYYNVNNVLSLRNELGYVKARGGALSSAYFNVGLSYRIGLLTGK